MGRKSRLVASDKKYVWHPFTQMADWQRDDPSPPLVIDRGRGAYLYDIDGKKYLDGVSSLWVNVFGHRIKQIDDAVRFQLNKISHTTFLGLTHEPAIRLAERLVKIAPRGLEKVFYSDNGSTSVEIALKMAIQYAQSRGGAKNEFLSLKNAYHGDTIGSVSVGGMELFHSRFRKLLFKTNFAPSPYCYRCPKRKRKKDTGQQARNCDGTNFRRHVRHMGCGGECIEIFEKILKDKRKKTAAVIVEPMVQGAAGMITMPPGYLKGIEALARKYDVLLICDEVATGFGRTGRMFACEHEGIRPDIMCVAKGLTGGYLPLAATLTTKDIFDSFLGKYEEFKTFFHGHSYTANPLACAAANAALDMFQDGRIIKKAGEAAASMRVELKKLEGLAHVGDIRQIGMMAGIELVQDKVSLREFDAKFKIAQRVCASCRNEGLIIRPLGNVIVLMPPLTISQAEIRKISRIVGRSIIGIPGLLNKTNKKSRI